MSDQPTIDRCAVRRVWDSRGKPTIEVELETAGRIGIGIAPSGASTGSLERREHRDGGERLGGADVADVATTARTLLDEHIVGTPADFVSVDAVLDRLDPDRAAPLLGSNVTTATSFAAARLQSELANQPLWTTLGNGDGTIPVPQIQIVGGGAHAPGSLDLQDLMVVPFGAPTFAEALVWVAEVYRALPDAARGQLGHGVADEGGYWPDFATNEAAIEAVANAIEATGIGSDRMAISIDVAAAQLVDDDGRYRWNDQRIDRAQMIDTMAALCDDFPVALIEDPLDEAEVDGHRELRDRLSARVVGDDLLVTDPERVALDAADVLLLKPNQAGSLSAARRAFDAARAANMAVIASARSGETEDVTIAHVAVGWCTDLLKVGSITRGERTAKWNEVVRLEERTGFPYRGTDWPNA